MFENCSLGDGFPPACLLIQMLQINFCHNLGCHDAVSCHRTVATGAHQRTARFDHVICDNVWMGNVLIASQNKPRCAVLSAQCVASSRLTCTAVTQLHVSYHMGTMTHGMDCYP